MLIINSKNEIKIKFSSLKTVNLLKIEHFIQNKNTKNDILILKVIGLNKTVIFIFYFICKTLIYINNQ